MEIIAKQSLMSSTFSVNRGNSEASSRRRLSTSAAVKKNVLATSRECWPRVCKTSLSSVPYPVWLFLGAAAPSEFEVVVVSVYKAQLPTGSAASEELPKELEKSSTFLRRSILARFGSVDGSKRIFALLKARRTMSCSRLACYIFRRGTRRSYQNMWLQSFLERKTLILLNSVTGIMALANLKAREEGRSLFGHGFSGDCRGLEGWRRTIANIWAWLRIDGGR